MEEGDAVQLDVPSGTFWRLEVFQLRELRLRLLMEIGEVEKSWVACCC